MRSCKVFDPAILVSKSFESNKKRLKLLLIHLIKLKVLSATQSDKCLSEFTDFLYKDVKEMADKFENFERKKDKLDSFTFLLLVLVNTRSWPMF